MVFRKGYFYFLTLLLLAIWLVAIVAFFFPITMGLRLKKEARNIALLLLVQMALSIVPFRLADHVQNVI